MFDVDRAVNAIVRSIQQRYDAGWTIEKLCNWFHMDWTEVESFALYNRDGTWRVTRH